MDRNYPVQSSHERRKRRKSHRMEAKSTPEAEFDTAVFEKKLQSLKDSQESINNCCHWCLENRTHHKKIVSSWLNVLKRVKVEQRVTLFYLANDVIQYSKRRNYEFVESWGTTLQKATTMVRDERVKHKILRIFKIWEQRGVYNEEFIADLSGLISATPSKKSDDPHEFQSSYLISKIKNCTSLENDTDAKLKKLKEHNPKIQIEKAENLCSSLKDRAHVDDVEREIEDYAAHIEAYVNALKAEIKARTNLISLLVQADTQLESDRRDVKLVANAYKTFGTRVKNVKKKLDEILPTLTSPIPSPDINAPSPSPDSDLELPDNTASTPVTIAASTEPASGAATTAPLPSVGYYNQLPITSSESNNFNSSSFSSFIGSNMPFSLQNFNASDLFTTNTTVTAGSATQTTNTYSLNNSLSSFFQALVHPPPPPDAAPPPAAGVTTPVPPFQGVPPPVTSDVFQGVPPPPPVTSGFQYGSNHMPLLPPPMPPFSKEGGAYGNGAYCTDVYSTVTAPSTGYGADTSTYDTSSYPPPNSEYQSPFDNPPPPYDPNSYHQASDDSSLYNEVMPGSTSFPADNQWNNQGEWNVDTPESPPTFEKEAYSEPIEYHDTVNHAGGGGDVDHRILRPVPTPSVPDTLMSHRGKDVDHRNLISLTGSPADVSNSSNSWNSKQDKDYRVAQPVDRDYRVPFNLEQLKQPPPPPPPGGQIKPNLKPGLSPRKLQDNVESIDMDLSDDELQQSLNENIKVLVDPMKENAEERADLMPPPPFPELPDDVDANNLLEDLNSDLNCGEYSEESYMDEAMQLFGGEHPPWAAQPDNNWMEPQNFGPDFNSFRGRGNVKRGNWGGQRGGFDFRGRGRGFPPFRGRGPMRGGRGGNYNFGNRGRGRGGFRGNFRGGY